MTSLENPLSEFIRQKAQDKPVAEVLADILRSKIINGDLLPGERVVEAEIAKLYGLSRGPVREALRILDSEGLLTVEKFRSPTVRGVDTKVFAEMFQVRGVLEAFAASLAAQNIRNSKTDLRWAKDQLAAWKSQKYATDVNAHVAANKELHERLLAIAANDVLAAQIKGLIMPGYRATLETLLAPESMQESAEQHVRILEAVIEGDPEKAEAAMRVHIGAAGATALRNFSTKYLDPRMSELRRLQAESAA
jgi:DNA-binding GntR family transcriptional regulator